MADINKKLDYLYDAGLSSRNQKRGEAQVFGICAGVLDNCYALEGEDLLSEIVGIVGNILLHPVTNGAAFDAAYTESEKNNLIDAINANINNKAYYAKKRCTEEMCRGERYGLPENGTIGDVQAITPESLYNQYRYALKHYPIEIFFVGQTDEDRLAEKLRAVFAGLERDIISVPAPEIVRAVSDVKRIDEDMPVNQGKLVIGMRSGVTLHDPDYPAMLMFNEIFGGGVTSKLFMNVREKMSLCYYCSSSPDSYKGLLFVQSGIEVENREVAETAINDQLEAVRRGEFTEEEMRSASSRSRQQLQRAVRQRERARELVSRPYARGRRRSPGRRFGAPVGCDEGRDNRCRKKVSGRHGLLPERHAEGRRERRR